MQSLIYFWQLDAAENRAKVATKNSFEERSFCGEGSATSLTIAAQRIADQRMKNAATLCFEMSCSAILQTAMEWGLLLRIGGEYLHLIRTN